MENTRQIITDSEADRTVEYLQTGSVVPAQGFSEWKIGCRNRNSSSNIDNGLTSSELNIVKAVVENPMLPSSDYVKLAGVSPNTLRKARPVLLEKGYIKEHLISNKRGRSTRLWEPLEQAKKLVAEKKTEKEQ